MKGLAKITIILVALFFLTGIAVFYFSQRPSKLSLESLKKGKMKLTSSVFENNQSLPAKYTCDEENINPPLEIEAAPAGTKSLTLIVDDPDAPRGVWVHWLVWNIDPLISSIEQNTVPGRGVEGLNDFGRHSYDGPCPPSGTHRYYFKLFALDVNLELGSSAGKREVEKAMKGHILDRAEIIGLYQR